METKKYKNKYSGLSLVEMLITVLIVGFVLVIVSSTLVAMIKASAISAARTLSRNEAQYLENQLQRYIFNSQAENIAVYTRNPLSTGNRYINDEGTIVTDNGYKLTNIGENSTDAGFEIQFRPIGSNNYVCIAFIPSQNDNEQDENIGYLVKSEVSGVSGPPDVNCMRSGNATLVNAEEIDVETFDIYFYSTASGNVTYVFDLAVKPTYWAPGKESRFKPEYYKQIVVSTRLLTYY